MKDDPAAPGTGGSLSPKVAAIGWSAQQRRHRRYWALQNKSKPSAKIVTALARELAGFVWAIGVETERTLRRLGASMALVRPFNRETDIPGRGPFRSGVFCRERRER